MLRQVARRLLASRRTGADLPFVQGCAYSSHRAIPGGCEDVPQGQSNANLEAWACNASLLRRKELGLLSHVELLVEGQVVSPRDLFQASPGRCSVFMPISSVNPCDLFNL